MKSYSIIDKSLIAGFLDRKSEALQNIDPDRIYVENIRSFFSIPYSWAKLFCEMATKQKYFVKKIGVYCPNKSCHKLILSVDKTSDIPSTINCHTCEMDEQAKYNFNLNEVETMEYYQLKKK